MPLSVIIIRVYFAPSPSNRWMIFIFLSLAINLIRCILFLGSTCPLTVTLFCVRLSHSPAKLPINGKQTEHYLFADKFMENGIKTRFLQINSWIMEKKTKFFSFSYLCSFLWMGSLVYPFYSLRSIE